MRLLQQGASLLSTWYVASVTVLRLGASKVHAGLDGVSPMLLFLQRPVANVEVANVEVGLGSIGLNVEDGPNLSGINFNASFAVVDL